MYFLLSEAHDLDFCIPEQFSIFFGSHLSERSDEQKNLIVI